MRPQQLLDRVGVGRSTHGRRRWEASSTGRDYATASTTVSDHSVQPAREIRRHEYVVGELRVERADAVDLLALAGAQVFRRIEAPPALEQALPAEHLVAAGDHAVERVRDIEEGGVAVGYGAVEREQVRGHGVQTAGGATALEDRHGRPRLHRP